MWSTDILFIPFVFLLEIPIESWGRPVDLWKDHCPPGPKRLKQNGLIAARSGHPSLQTPQAGEESVWDYPRPPRIEPDRRLIVIASQGKIIAECHFSYRVLETASPPTFYIPPAHIHFSLLATYPGSSACEWKGYAQYWSINIPDRPQEAVAWDYPDPFTGYQAIAGYLSFYPNRVECFVDGNRVTPQPGGLYGGWVTPEVVGPFKGEPGTEYW